MKRRAFFLAAMGLAASGLFVVAVLVHSGPHGLHVLLRQGVHIWVPVEADDARLSPSMQMALQDAHAKVNAGALAWHVSDVGLEVGELPVLAGEHEVDRILLARIDPAHFKFAVQSHATGSRAASDWLQHLDAVMVINGSYFSRYGTPSTPIVASGVKLGPETYDARHGAFVASASGVGIRDLAQTGWSEAFRDVDEGMVSYPLLLAADGSSRSNGDERWLANRSFVAQDREGRIVLGTTREAFFSLNELAAFLREAPLGLKLALNLDGGPVACQAIAWKDYRRDFCGGWETTVEDGRIKLLTPMFRRGKLGLPIVLAVLRK